MRDPTATPGAVVIALRAVQFRRLAVQDAAADEGRQAVVCAEVDEALSGSLSDEGRAEAAVGEDLSPALRVWGAVLGVLRAQTSRGEFEQWLQPTKLLGVAGGVVTIGVASPFQKEGLENHYMGPIRRALYETLGGPFQIRVVVGKIYTIGSGS